MIATVELRCGWWCEITRRRDWRNKGVRGRTKVPFIEGRHLIVAWGIGINTLRLREISAWSPNLYVKCPDWFEFKVGWVDLWLRKCISFRKGEIDIRACARLWRQTRFQECRWFARPFAGRKIWGTFDTWWTAKTFLKVLKDCQFNAAWSFYHLFVDLQWEAFRWSHSV